MLRERTLDGVCDAREARRQLAQRFRLQRQRFRRDGAACGCERERAERETQEAALTHRAERGRVKCAHSLHARAAALLGMALLLARGAPRSHRPQQPPRQRCRRGALPPRRAAACAAAAAALQPLPPAAGPWVWRGPELAADPAAWSHALTPEELSDLAAAADACAGRELASITARDAPLRGALAARLAGVRRELLSGRGLFLLRGMPVADWGVARSAAAFWALGLALGVPLPQNGAGHLLGHVKDIGGDASRPETRLYTTAAAQPYHTDSADLVGLLCLAQAAAGGDSQVVSSAAVHNEVLRAAPSLAAQLAQPFAYDRKGEVPPGCAPVFHVPVFCHVAGRLVSMYDRSFISAAQARFAAAGTVARLTPEQAAALDAADAAAASDALRLDMRLAPGDMQFLHSHTTWHARGAFSDGGARGARSGRHLLRLWLAPAPEEAWELPDAFAARYGSVARDATPPRGGIRVAGARLHAPLTAEQPL